jgi:hypothetical protein
LGPEAAFAGRPGPSPTTHFGSKTSPSCNKRNPTLTAKANVTDHNRRPHGRPHPPAGKGIQKDWRVWVVIGLMLLAMLIYILTLDESRRPW